MSGYELLKEVCYTLIRYKLMSDKTISESTFRSDQAVGLVYRLSYKQGLHCLYP